MSVPYDTQQPVSQQPIASQGMTVNPRNSLNKPNVGDKGRDWSYDLCGCNNIGTFLVAWCFPCIVYGSSKERLNHLEHKGTPDPNHGGIFNSDCCIYSLLSCCGISCLLQCRNRETVRHRYGIDGEPCTDCLASYFCTPCALAQEEAEIDLEEKALAQQGDYQK